MGLLDYLQDETLQGQQPVTSHREEILDTLEHGVYEGQRNNRLTQLAGKLRAHGLGQGEIYQLISAVNSYHSIGLPQNELQQIARSIVRYPVTLENRNPKEADILTFEDCARLWRTNSQHFDRIKTGFDHLDGAIIKSFGPGEVFTIAARSGAGKTSLALPISRGIARSLGSRCLFVSLEMDGASIFIRSATEYYSQASNSAKTFPDTVEMVKSQTFVDQLCEHNASLLIVDKDSLTLEQIETYLNTAREKNKVDLLTIDYLGYINDCDRGSSYEKVSRTARAIKGLAKRTGIRIILLCQTSRQAEDGFKPVQLHHLRDSGAIEESADYILGVWYAKSTEEKRVHSEVLKNRHGSIGERFDFINRGLYYTETYYKEEKSKREKFE